MSKHTPGPWFPGHYGRDDHPCNCRAILCDHLMGCIATIQASDDHDKLGQWAKEYPPPEEAKANACLIAASTIGDEIVSWLETGPLGNMVGWLHSHNCESAADELADLLRRYREVYPKE